MATNGILKFQGTNKATFVGATSNVVIDTVKSSLGIGVDVDGPTSNLHVVGNAYVSTELTVGGTVTAAGFAGNATTASALAASVNIGGVAFDGSAAIVPTTFTAATFSGDVTVDSTTFHVDSTNNRVGVGTTSPVQKLHLYDTTTEPTIAIQHLSADENNSSTNILGNLCLHRSHRSGVGNQVGIRSIRRADTWDDQADMEFYVRNGGYGEQTAMVINSGGTSATSAKVGIGVTDPQRSLHVKSTSGMMIEDNATTSAIYVDNVAQGETGEVYSYILNAPRPGTTGSGAVHFINGSGRTGDGGASTYTIRNDSGKLRLGGTAGDTIIEGNVNFAYTEKFNLFYAPSAWGYSTTTVAAHVNLWTFDVVIPQEGYLIASVNGHWNHSTAGHYVYVSIGVDSDDPADTSGFYDNYTVGGAGTQGGNFHSYKDSSTSWQDLNWSGTFKVAAGTRTISLRMFSQSGTAYVNGAAIKLMYIPKYYF